MQVVMNKSFLPNLEKIWRKSVWLYFQEKRKKRIFNSEKWRNWAEDQKARQRDVIFLT